MPRRQCGTPPRRRRDAEENVRSLHPTRGWELQYPATPSPRRLRGGVFRFSSRLALGILAAAILPACAGTTQVQRAGTDQEITTQILWRYREDPRFAAVQVTCTDRIVTLEGRVDDRLAHEDALRIARDQARGSQVLSKIIVRPR